MRTLRLTAALTMLLVVTGCAAQSVDVVAPSPVASPSSEPAAEPTRDSTVVTAVIYGTRIEWRNAAGDVIDSIGFKSELTAFASKITGYFGAAEADDDGRCASFVYDGLAVVQASGSGLVEILVMSSEINGIRMETPSGISIGEDASALLASTAPELKQDMDSTGDYPYWSLVYDTVGTWGEGGPEPRQYGAGAIVYEDVLSHIFVPADVGTMHLSC